MASTIKEFFEISRSKEGLNGFILAVWIIVTLLTSFGWILGIELHGQTITYWAESDRTKLTSEFRATTAQPNTNFILNQSVLMLEV